MIKTKIFYLAIVINLAMLSCQDPVVPEQKAVQMTKEELKNTIGYEWFNGYWTLYKPDTTVTNNINLAFDSTIYKFVIFIEPSCTCKELVKESADLIKVLDVANINTNFYEIYSMGGVTSKHPFEDKINFKTLPQMYLVKSGEFVYSILDSFDYYEGRNFKKIEAIVLEALQKN